MAFQDLTTDQKLSLLMQSVNGKPDAAYRMGNSVQEGAYGRELIGFAHQFYRLAAYGGHPQAMYELGLCYRWGEGGVYADPDHAIGWFKKAAEQGIPEAADIIARFDSDDGKLILLQSAVSGAEGFGSKWYVSKQLVDEYYRLANEGNGEAQYELARQLSNPNRTGPFRYNIEEAVKWYSSAAKLGVVDAMFNLGALYLNGVSGLEPNPAMAQYWFTMASDAGDDEAYAMLLTHFPDTV